MASETSALQPHSRPLLQDFNHDNDPEPKYADVSLSSLEDGDDSTVYDSDEEEFVPRSSLGFWTRLRMSIERRRGGVPKSEFYGESRNRNVKNSRKLKWRKRCIAKLCVIAPFLVLIFLGVIHLLELVLGFDPATGFLDWTRPDQVGSDYAKHLLDITRGVKPIPCHSHNDYWRRVPLYDALYWGCTGVEADVWLFDSDLFVGHSTRALTSERTFRTMYVDPLVKMLDHKNDLAESSTVKNGIFDADPAQTLVLLVDFKNDGHKIFPVVSQQLNALREKSYLSYYNGERTIEGPITVVATGNAPFDLIIANQTYRDIFFDAPLDRLYIAPEDSTIDAQHLPSAAMEPRGGQGTVGTTPSSHFDASNSYYASVSFGRSIGWLWFGMIRDSQRELIRGQIAGAHARGLKARYWSAPKWPTSLRNTVWEMLLDMSVDYLNGDDLKSMAGLDWDKERGEGLRVLNR